MHTRVCLNRGVHGDSCFEPGISGAARTLPLGDAGRVTLTWSSIFCPFTFIRPRFWQVSWEELRHVVPSLGSSRLALMKNVALFSFFPPRLFSVPFIHQILKWVFFRGGASRCNGRSIFLTARESEAACQMVNLNRGSCCHGDAKLHPVAVATKVKKLMLRQENHMMYFFFV